jgi:hypothetical protein
MSAKRVVVLAAEDVDLQPSDWDLHDIARKPWGQASLEADASPQEPIGDHVLA